MASIEDKLTILAAAAKVENPMIKTSFVKKMGPAAAVLVLLALVVAWSMAGGKKGAASQAYRLAPVTRGAIKATVSCSGTLNPLNTVKVGSQVSGIIKELYADFNTPVRRDQVIALLDPAFHQAQVDQALAQVAVAKAQHQENVKSIIAAEAAVDSAGAQRNSAAATLREAELKHRRLAGLDRHDAVAKSELDAAQAKMENARGALEMAEAQIKTARDNLNRIQAQQEGTKALITQREAALNLAQIQLRYCTITSPIDGIVISRHVDMGQTVAASLQSPVLFTIAEDLSRMQVEADVSEADVGQIQPEQEVEFTVDAFADTKYRAKVRQVRNAANTVQNVVTYTIVADVANPSLVLRPGMTANATLIVAEVGDAFRVPNAALRFKPAGAGQEQSPHGSVPIRQRRVFKEPVEKIGLDPAQADQLEEIIKAAAVDLKAAYAQPEDQRDILQAWKNFYAQVNQKLYRILRPDQHDKFKSHIEALKASYEKRKANKLKTATVYVPDDRGRPQVRNVLAGVTDETVTQVLTEEFKEGDNVIVGLAVDTAGAKSQRASLLSTLLGR